MIAEPTSEPLRRFPAVRTTDIEQFGDVLRTVYGAVAFDIPDAEGFEARGNFVQLENIALAFSSCKVRSTVEFPEADYVRQQIALTGRASTTSGRATTEIHSLQSCITSPDRAAKLSYDTGYSQLILRIKKSALERKLALILGAKPKGRLEFESASTFDPPHARSLYHLINFVAAQIDTTANVVPPMVLRQLQQAITIGFLYANRHTFSGLLDQEEKDAPPRHVRRVEDYIETHWNEAISISVLAEITGVSARAMFKAFRLHRGYSPMAFAKKIRLKHANEMLCAPDKNTSVTSVAFACGFANLGHFANDYRELFRERPSETLARAK